MDPIGIDSLQISELSKALTTKEAAQEILANFLPLVSQAQLQFNGNSKFRGQHLISKSLLPTDFEDWVPIATAGDGNCLFHSVSILLSGNQSLASVLRLLTVSELFAHSEFYANHPQLIGMAQASGYSVPALLAILFSDKKAQAVYNGNRSNAAHAVEVLAQGTAKPFVFSSHFHILALASVIGKPIYSVYPDIPTALAIKKALHGVFYPREVLLTTGGGAHLTDDFVAIMWTRVQRSPRHGWVPNHFVPLVKAFQFVPTMSYASAVSSGRSFPHKAQSKGFRSSKPSQEFQLPFLKPKCPAKKFYRTKSSNHEHGKSNISGASLKTHQMAKERQFVAEKFPYQNCPPLPEDESNHSPTNKKNSSTSRSSKAPTSTRTSSTYYESNSSISGIEVESSSSFAASPVTSAGQALPHQASKGFSLPSFSKPSQESKLPFVKSPIKSKRKISSNHGHGKSKKSDSFPQTHQMSEERQFVAEKVPHQDCPPSPPIAENKFNPHEPNKKKYSISSEAPTSTTISSTYSESNSSISDIDVESMPLYGDVQNNPSYQDKVQISVDETPDSKISRDQCTFFLPHPRQFVLSSTGNQRTKASVSHTSESSSSSFPTMSKKCNMYSRTKVHRRKRNSSAAGASMKPKPVDKSQEKSAKSKSFLSFFTSEKRMAVSCDEKDKHSDPATMDVHTALDPQDYEAEEVLPLAGPGFQWYKEKGVNASANVARSEERMKNSVIVEDNEIKGLVRGSVTGTLMQNIDVLIEKLSAAGSVRQQEHLSAMISLAKYLMENGLLVATQDLAKKYKQIKGLKESSRIESSRLLEIMVKHLNVIQIYIEGKGYVTENRGKEIVKFAESIQNIERMDRKIINKKVEQAIGSNYNTILEYLDSKRDRDTMKAVLTKITSTNFMTKLANVQDKRTFRRSKDLVTLNLQLFEGMKKSLEQTDTTVNDAATRKKRYRTLQKMKLEKLRHVFKGRGKDLKSEEFPDLAAILEFAFGEEDRVDRAGGGLESHPRLIDTVLYRAADSNTIMRHARETILALAPEGFNISLSSCFNYTQNYREGTYQAKRHHSGRGINACLSLHKPPRTGVEQFVVNLHWSTHNVNLTLDYAHCFPNNIMVDSKDAKAKIQADVSPVQKPGKTWRKITLPDHDWSRSVTNAITPMTHLFLETDLNFQGKEDEDYFYRVRRTGTAATLLNVSYFEPQTVQRVYNEILLLMINPVLDKLFRNPDTGKLKEHFVFIVDNGPSEAPSSPLVRMWLVRLARILGLKSVTQKSFAEYHSKRNPVERVHAVHNHALSNEQFSSKAVHQEFEIGDQRHLENMEHMANEVQKCLAHTQYGGRPCTALRGIGKEGNFVFNDEEMLITFLGKSECRKYEDDMDYRPVQNDLWNELTTLWNLDENYSGSYREDYQIIQNSLEEEGERTCWMGKYTTTIFNPDLDHEEDQKTLAMQPIPDYVRWLKTGGELHYLPLEKAQNLETQVIDETPEAFLPSKVLEIIFKVFSNGIENVLPCISFLSWCTEDDVKRFYSDFKEKLDKTFLNEKEREYWSQDKLYQENNKAELQALCKKNGISVEGKNHECVKRLVEKMGEKLPPSLDKYDGKPSSLPNSVTEIKKMSVYKLREILRFHNILDCGTKDELALRVGMVRAERSYLAFYKEMEATLNIITAARTIIKLEKDMYLKDPTIIHKRRKYSTPSGPSISTSRPRDSASIPHQNKSAFLIVPEGINLENLDEVLDPLESEIGLYRQTSSIGKKDYSNIESLNMELVAIRSLGARVLTLWSKEEVGSSGWKTGWYIGTVVTYTAENDTIEVEFDTEKGVKYKYSVAHEVNGNKMKLAQSTQKKIKDYEEICEIGAEVEMKWTKEDLTDTDWPAGWYTAEVQSVDYDDDEVDLVFLEEPACVYIIAVMPNLVSGTLRLKHA